MAKLNRTSHAYIIRTLSPLHMGAGDASYGVIDKLVQRDSLTDYPILHSSGIKGALREYFDYWLSSRHEPKDAKKTLDLIFGQGTPTKEDDKQEKKESYAAGLYDFDLGFLLSLPVRTDKAAYVSATTPEILNNFLERLELFGLDDAFQKANEILQPLLIAGEKMTDKPLVFSLALDNAILEDDEFKATQVPLESLAAVEALIGKNPALVPKDMFESIAESLPVIARNKLDNGQSKNLWYEETVPRESRFYTIISKASWENTEHSMADLGGLFDTVLKDNRIQLGGNATVGYGKTVFTQI